ncbi:putative 6-phosphofructo-2-kinase/fructose-2,6-biphosphata se [Trypanosoma vivax]|nr:putative 6-phosphofructo-2-kinase/fructose-2,6-biphosphata se [Trypanosoma vivax]
MEGNCAVTHEATCGECHGHASDAAQDCDNTLDDSELSHLKKSVKSFIKPFSEWKWREATHFKELQNVRDINIISRSQCKVDGYSSALASVRSAPTASTDTAGVAVPVADPAPNEDRPCSQLSHEKPLTPTVEMDTFNHTDSPSVNLTIPLDNYMIPISSQGPEHFNATAQSSTTTLCIIMVGLPARGKTFLAQKICRLLGWHGLRAKVLNVQVAWRHLLLEHYRKLACNGRTKGNPECSRVSQPALSQTVSSATENVPEDAIYRQRRTVEGSSHGGAPKPLDQWKDKNEGRSCESIPGFVRAEHFRALVSDSHSIERTLYCRVLKQCAADARDFYSDGGEVLVVNDDFPTAELRDEVEALFSPLATQTFFIEVTRQSDLNKEFNEFKVRDTMEYHPGVQIVDAHQDFARRLAYLESVYTTIDSTPSCDTPVCSAGETAKRPSPKRYIKVKNFSEIEVCGVTGYIGSRIISFAMNITQLKVRHPIYFMRHGMSKHEAEDRIGGDSELAPEGERDIPRLLAFTVSLQQHVGQGHSGSGIQHSGDYTPQDYSDDNCSLPNDSMDSVISGIHQVSPTPSKTRGVIEIWTSRLRRATKTVEKWEALLGVETVHWGCLNELHAGVCENLTRDEVREQHPLLEELRDCNKYSFRYPEGESYKDLVQRLEPIIMELENADRVVVVVAHKAVLRALLAYFGSTSAESCVFLDVPYRTVWRCTYNSKGITSLEELQLDG